MYRHNSHSGHHSEVSQGIDIDPKVDVDKRQDNNYDNCSIDYVCHHCNIVLILQKKNETIERIKYLRGVNKFYHLERRALE